MTSTPRLDTYAMDNPDREENAQPSADGAAAPPRSPFGGGAAVAAPGDDSDLRSLRIDMLLDEILDAFPLNAQTTMRTLWLFDWDEQATAKALGVTPQAIRIARYRFLKSAQRIVKERPGLAERYEELGLN